MKLSCRDLRVRYGDVEALAGVDLDLAAGHRLSIVGPSGCGKSTLLRVVAGLVPTADGTVFRDGADITGLPPHQRQIGLMFQEHALFPHRNVAENVEFGLRMQGRERDVIDGRVHELLELVGLATRHASRIDELSGGERQRVALARTLAPGPELVLLDEPLASLDRVLRTDLLDEITGIFTHLSITAVAVTHDIDEAFRFGTDVAVMAPARIDRIGPAPEVWNEPGTPYTARFLGYAPVVGRGAADSRISTIFASAIAAAGLTPPDEATHVAVAPGGLVPSAAGPIEGMVTRISYEQGAWRLVVELDDETEVVVHAARRHDPGLIRLELVPDRVRFVQPTSSAV